MAAIFDEIGGEPAVSAAVEIFYGKVLDDPSLAGYFDRVDMAELQAHQRAFIGAALGGPAPYEGRSMKEAHEGLGITSEAFDVVVGHLGDTLTDLGVPAPTIDTIAGVLAPLKTEIVS
ncbi:MAG: group 1 truncated hemoglobin [Actinobacteria bacterium]|nr:MAG: group 1 truncated hemoglobin [Actinomycetota bacterium]